MNNFIKEPFVNRRHPCEDKGCSVKAGGALEQRRVLYVSVKLFPPFIRKTALPPAILASDLFTMRAVLLSISSLRVGRPSLQSRTYRPVVSPLAMTPKIIGCE